MNKNNKLYSEDVSRQESFDDIENIPLKELFQLFEIPKKPHLDVYIEILRRWILKSPYNINMGCYNIMAYEIGVDSDIIKKSVILLDRAGFIDIECWTLYPCFKLHEKVTKRKFAEILEKYRQAIDKKKKKEIIKGGYK